MNFYVSLLLLSACSVNILPTLVIGINQKTIDLLAADMDLKHDIVSNFIGGVDMYKLQLTITNRGKTLIEGNGWVIYFCYMRWIAVNSIERPVEIKITHLQGCGYTLEPVSRFKPILPNQVKTIRVTARAWIVSRSDLMPNWYITAPGLTPRTILSTAGESLSFVGDFDKVEKWKRYDYKSGTKEIRDRYDPYTPLVRYAVNHVEDLGKSPSYVIPTPLEIEVEDSKTICLDTRDWVVIYPSNLLNEATYLTKKFPVEKTSKKPLRRYIELEIKPVQVKMNGGLLYKFEGYSLEVNPEKEYIKITGQDSAGVFYGIQSLMSLTSVNYTIPKSKIRDAPRFAYRGIALDVARNFFDKKAVFKLFDMMATYKMNYFQFHLFDDEGWRLQIEDLDELTEVGGHRCHDLTETHCIMPQLGSGPTTVGSGSGFYTKKDYQEILQYAKDRHIHVIPELDMPGHSHALIKAMQSRFQKLSKGGNTSEANRYVLIDSQDTSQYKSIEMYRDNVINPCMESTYNFIEKLIKTLISYHESIMPLKIYHYGGTKVPRGSWENSKACKEIMKKLKLHDKEALKEYFVQRVSNITNSLGLNLGAWEGAVMTRNVPHNRSKLANQEVYAYSWYSIWDKRIPIQSYKLANAGYKVVMSPGTHLFLDHPYEPDPEEPGIYWTTRFINTRKVFGLMPENIYANANVTKHGDPITQQQLCGKDGKNCVKLEKSENIAGIQGQIWSKIVRSTDRFDYMVYPRLLALAERAWHRASWELEKDKLKREKQRDEDWSRFANTLGYRELKRLDWLGIKYRVPPPGAIHEGRQIKVNSPFPGLTVESSVNDGKFWHNVDNNTKYITEKSVLLRTRSPAGCRYSRVVKLTIPTQEVGEELTIPTQELVEKLTKRIHELIRKNKENSTENGLNGSTQLLSSMFGFLALIISASLLEQI